MIIKKFTKILLLLETYQRPIGDQHVFTETNMPHQRPENLKGDQHVSSEIDMPHWSLIGDRYADHIRDQHARLVYLNLCD